MARLKSLLAWWHSIPLPWRPWRVVGWACVADEVPDRLPHKGVVLIGEQGRESWAAFDCPCRTGHRLLVNLDQERHPFWRVVSLKPLTIFPSIDDMTSSRRCHFTVRGGKVRWTHYNRSVTK